MKNSKTVELAVGFFVALGMLALLMLALKVSNLGSFFGGESYEITAHFTNVGGLKEKSPVKMAGVKIGAVSTIVYDDNRYEALVTLKIGGQYNKIPADSSASIYTAGLLGEQYIGLDAGGDDVYLTDGNSLQITQSAVVLEQLIGQFLYKSAAESKSK